MDGIKIAIPKKQTNKGIKYFKYFLFSLIWIAFLNGITQEGYFNVVLNDEFIYEKINFEKQISYWEEKRFYNKFELMNLFYIHFKIL